MKSKNKRNLIVVLSSLIVVAAAAYVLINLYASPPKPNVDAVLEFIQQNPDRASVAIMRNEEQLVGYKADRKMPLASVAKIVVAVEYAQQAAEEKIDPEQMVSLDEINRYYIPNLDGGAQEAWEQSVEPDMQSYSVPLKEVAKGMIEFSSNANMEYLMELLGLDNINLNLQKLGLSMHEPIYPFYSSVLIPYKLMAEYEDLADSEKIEKAKTELKKMPQERFRELALAEHKQLKNDVDGSYQKAVGLEKWYDEEFDKNNSDRMIGATATDYVILLSKINSRNYFMPEVHSYLDEVMESAMESEGNQELFDHLGFKGGSTNYILNSAIYAVDKEGNRTEVVLFTNELAEKDMELLASNLNEFLLRSLTSLAYQNEIADVLGD